MTAMQSICVFLGSNPGASPEYASAAKAMGKELALRGLTCIYGGSDTGLMKLLADSALFAGGKVIGVTVNALKDKEICHRHLTHLHVVSSMHERKNLMAELADGFVALPGGIGTLEEFFEIYTLNQLGFFSKPCGLLNVNNYYDPLDALLDNAEKQGFMKGSHRETVVRADTPSDLLDRLLSRQSA